jgi:hypothetical protein
MDNSVSLSPKGLFEESNILSHNKELIFNPEEDIIPNSPPANLNQNESEVMSKIYHTGIDEKSNESVTKLFTSNHNSRLTHRRLTETK